MNRQPPFYAAAFLLVLAGAAAAWPFLEGTGRAAVAWAALLCLAVQLPLHALTRGWRRSAEKFVKAVAFSFAVRAASVVAAIVLVVLPERAAPAPFLLALAVFLVSTSLVEAVLESRAPPAGRPAEA